MQIAGTRLCKQNEGYILHFIHLTDAIIQSVVQFGKQDQTVPLVTRAYGPDSEIT